MKYSAPSRISDNRSSATVQRVNQLDEKVMDNRPTIVKQRKLQEAANNKSTAYMFSPVQLKKSHTLSSGTGMVMQRWAVKEIADQKESLDDNEGNNLYGFSINVKSGEKNANTALHHIISRDSMKKLNKALNLAQSSKTMDVKNSASKFWKTTQSATNKEIRQQAKTSIALLENLPLNLSYGPKEPLDDPGTGFDPDTRPAANGGRELTPVSEQLAIINEIIESNSISELGKSSELWERLNGAMNAAIKLYASGDKEKISKINPSLREQWEIKEGENEDRYYRKGIKNFLNESIGEKRLKGSSIPADELELIGERAPRDEQSDKLSIYAYAETVNLSHFLERHTYEYFTLKDKDIKLINTFWEEGTTLDNIKEYARLALAYSKKHVKDLHRVTIDLNDEMPEFVGIKNVIIQGIPKPVYLMFGIEEVDDNIFEVDLRTLAPDGKVDAYTAEILKKVQASRLELQEK